LWALGSTEGSNPSLRDKTEILRSLELSAPADRLPGVRVRASTASQCVIQVVIVL